MASVREELIEELVNGDFDCSREEAEKAVDKAIADNGDQEDFGVDIDHTVEHIYTTQRYWD